MTHTPGPWFYHKCLCGQKGCSKYTISHSGANGMFEKADAHLITASPELLWFAKQIFNGLDTGLIKMDTPADETLENVLMKGREAVKKAEGE